MDEFLVLIEKHRDEFYRYIYRTAWDSGVADDIFSEAVLAAYQNRDKFQLGTNFRAWMFRIITNKCYVANRHTARSADSLDDGWREFAALEHQADYTQILENPESFLEKCGDEILRALKKLNTAERSCLLLRTAEHFSYQEIADILDIPIGTVMTHLSRGRAKLRNDLLDYAREEGVIKPALEIMTNQTRNREAV
jgi:RNA polymerase sigma-70 factor (ECF subfamily)